MLTARALKATLVLDPVEVAALPDPTTARITLRIHVGDRTVTADVAGKAVRKAKAAISECGVDGIAVIIQGKLAAGDVLIEAGLVAQPKTAKVEPPKPQQLGLADLKAAAQQRKAQVTA